MKHPPIVIVQTSSRSWHLAHLAPGTFRVPVYVLQEPRYADAVEALAAGHQAAKTLRTVEAASPEGGPA